jgi:uncharacterized protein (TIGR02118 family)
MPNRDGITRVFIARRRPDLSVEEFQRHWRGRHAEITLTFPDISRYVQNHAVQRDGRSIVTYPGFDVFSELDFESADAMDASWSSPEYVKGLEDENNFMDPRWSTVLVGVRHRVGDASRPPFRLVWLCAPRAAGGPMALDEASVTAATEQLRTTTGASSVAAVFATPELAERYPPRHFPAIFWIGFDDLGSLGRVMRGVLDVVPAQFGSNDGDATTVVAPNVVIGSEV